MLDLIQSPLFVTLLLLFYWVPFAVGSYFTDHYKHERTREWMHRHLHIGADRHAPRHA